jgi:hypothetical protein
MQLQVISKLPVSVVAFCSFSFHRTYARRIHTYTRTCIHIVTITSNHVCTCAHLHTCCISSYVLILQKQRYQPITSFRSTFSVQLANSKVCTTQKGGILNRCILPRRYKQAYVQLDAMIMRRRTFLWLVMSPWCTSSIRGTDLFVHVENCPEAIVSILKEHLATSSKRHEKFRYRIHQA